MTDNPNEYSGCTAYDANHGAPQFAKQFDRPLSAVAGTTTNSTCKTNRVSDEIVANLRAERAEGAPLKELVRKYGLKGVPHASMLARGLCRPKAGGPLGPKFVKPSLTPQAEAEILQTVNLHQFYLGRKHSPTTKLARKYGVDVSTLHRQILDDTVSFIDRFWKKVDRSRGPEGCWKWTGLLWQRTGTLPEKNTGRVTHNGRAFQAQRVAYALTYGAIPDKLRIKHKAPVDPSVPKHWCVNPLHWRPARSSGATHAE